LRRIASVLLLAVVAACGGEDRAEEPPPGEALQSTQTPSAPVLADDTALASSGILGLSQLQEPRFGDFDEMAERRIIRAVVAHSKTMFFLDGARPRGLTYEALTSFEEFVNERMGSGNLKVHVVITPVPRDRLLPALVEGRADIAAANLTITQDRLEIVDFSEPLLTGVNEVVVTGSNTPAIGSVQDLAGREIHVRTSSSYYESLQRLNAEFVTSGLEPVRIHEADEWLEDEDLLELVNAGMIPAIIVDKHMADFWVRVFDNLTVHDDVAVREGGSIAWALRKNSPELAAVLNEFAAGHRQGTLFGNVVLRRYLSSTDYVVNPTAGADSRRYQALLPVFEEYATQYGLDPLLLVAQAYQESRLDQSLVSGVGAVGVMQIRPSTAADPNVGIPDISSLEDNVHAGAKYLRFLSDRYFSDPSMTLLDQHLFALAAYNAGPARVARLRAEAADLGLDRNRWFGQVERVAARRIGRETVQYVSNIYKYYLFYRLDARDAREPSGQ